AVCRFVRAGQHYARSFAIKGNQVVIITIVNEGYILAASKIAQAVVEALVANWANHVQTHIFRHGFDQILNALMRQQAAYEEDASIAWAGRIGGKFFSIDSAENHVRPGFALMAKHLAAILADVKVPVVEAVGRNVGGDVPSASTKVRGKYAPA